jgi:hypothetical protein
VESSEKERSEYNDSAKASDLHTDSKKLTSRNLREAALTTADDSIATKKSKSRVRLQESACSGRRLRKSWKRRNKRRR